MVGLNRERIDRSKSERLEGFRSARTGKKRNDVSETNEKKLDRGWGRFLDLQFENEYSRLTYSRELSGDI